MFVFDKNRTFTGTCQSADGQRFAVTYRALPDEDALQHDYGSLEGEKTFLRAIVQDIPDIEDDKKQPLAFNDALFGELLEFPDIRNALLRGYRMGVTGAKTGN